MSDGQEPNAIDTAAKTQSRWGRLIDGIDSLKRLAFSVLIIAAIVVAVPIFTKLVTTKGVVLKDISVPSSLEDRGVTGAVIAQRILDHLHEIAAGSKKQQSSITDSSIESSMPEIQLPVGGLDLSGLLAQIRQFLGYQDTKISGEVTVDQAADDDKGTPATYSLRLRMGNHGVIYNSPHASDKIDSLIEEAATEIMHRFDPINLGFHLYKKKDYDNALRMTETAIANGTPGDDGWAFNMRGMIKRDQRNYPEAIAQFREAIRRQPSFAYAYNNLSQTLRLIGQLDEAAEVARKAIDLAPKDRQGYTNLALVMIEQGKGEDAIALMNKAIAAEPRNHHPHFDLGVILHRMKHMDAAASSFQRAAEIKPDYADAYVKLSNVLHVTGKYSEARALAQKAADVDPKSPMPWNLLGVYALDRKDYPHAVANFKKAVAIDKAFVDGYVNLGLAFTAQKKYADAIAAYQKAAGLDVTDAEILVHWADTLDQSGKRAEAAAKMGAAAELSHKPAAVFEHLGRLQESHGEIAAAIDSYNKAIGADPRLADILNTHIARLKSAKPAEQHTGTPKAAPAAHAKPRH